MTESRRRFHPLFSNFRILVPPFVILQLSKCIPCTRLSQIRSCWHCYRIVLSHRYQPGYIANWIVSHRYSVCVCAGPMPAFTPTNSTFISSYKTNAKNVDLNIVDLRDSFTSWTHDEFMADSESCKGKIKILLLSTTLFNGNLNINTSNIFACSQL